MGVNVMDFLDKEQHIDPDKRVSQRANGSRPAPPEDEDDDDDDDEYVMSGGLPHEAREQKDKDVDSRFSEEQLTQEPDELEQSMVSSTHTEATARTSKSENYADVRRQSKSSRDPDIP